MIMLVDLNSYDGTLFLTLAGIGYFVLSLYLHELGHLFMLKAQGYKEARVVMKDGDFHAGEDYMYQGRQAYKVYWSGILLGITPILFYMMIAPWPYYTIYWLLYLAGCWKDFQELLR